MKKLLLVAAFVATALGAMAQGTVNFKNSTALANPVFDTDGTTKLGDSAYVAQLLWSATPTGTFAVTTMSDGSASVAAPFRTGTGAGFWNLGSDPVRLAGVATGAAASFKVQVWNPADGATFAAASAKGGAKVGESSVFTVASTGGAGSPPALPSDLSTLTSFSLKVVPNVPEPSTIALGLIGAGALLLRRRK